RRRRRRRVDGMDGTQEGPLLVSDAPIDPSKNDVESNTKIVYKKRKRSGGCCQFCCKILCVCFAIIFLIIALSIIIPYVRESFAPLKTEVEWSAPHTERHAFNMKSRADNINRQNLTWKARYNPFAHKAYMKEFEEYSIEYGKERLVEVIEAGVHVVKEGISPEDRMGDTIQHIEELKNMRLTLPSSFDAREKWPRCSSIHQISNQGACGSCWAMSASSVMSDRLCISSNYTRQETISTQDLLSCCPTCGSCGGGGFLISAFKLWKERGLVTGGAYGSNEGCKPYQIENKCGYPCSIDYYTKDRTPKCEEKCQPLYNKRHDEDLIKSRKAYWLRSEPMGDESSLDWREKEQRVIDKSINRVVGVYDMEDLLKKELMIFGPVMGCIIIEENFLLYESGIFDMDRWDFMYSHCMKLIGWGEEGGVKYWTYANSWGRNWGENGFIRINRRDIPSDIAAGIF
ncbi:hypothetical protein PENTCL1PPCAC_6195, partial [Pristionchus entomophagus]